MSPLPHGVRLTKAARKVFNVLEKDPHATLREIETRADVSHETAVKWRKIYEESNGDTTEDPSNVVTHEVRAEDPMTRFGERTTPPPKTDPQPHEKPPIQQEKNDPKPDTPLPAPPTPPPSPAPDTPTKRRIREIRV